MSGKSVFATTTSSQSRSTSSQSHRGRRWVVLGVAFLSPGLLSHCGGESPAGSGKQDSQAATVDDASSPPVEGDRAQAMTLYRKAIPLLGTDPGRALALIQKSVAADPSLAPARAFRAQLLMRPGLGRDLNQALEDVEFALQVKPDSTELLTAQGTIYFELGDSASAEPLLRAVLKQLEQSTVADAQSGFVRGVLGRIYLRRGDLNEAEPLLQQAEAESADAVTALSLSRLAGDRGNLKDQERYLNLTLERDPLHLSARHERQQLYRRSGRSEEATREQQVQSLLRKDSEDTSAEYAGNPSARADLWWQLSELLPEVLACRTRAIKYLVQARRHDEIADYGMAAVQAGLGDPEALYYVALSLAKAGRFQEAEQVAVQMSRSRPPPNPQTVNALRQQILKLQQRQDQP